MNQTEKKQLESYTERVAKLLEEKREIDDEIKELIAEASEKLGLRKGNIRKAAKEWNLSELDRADRRQVEEEMHEIRSALGLLADLPLGEAAMDATGKKTSRRVKKIAEEAGATI